jgi:hypothetical protein
VFVGFERVVVVLCLELRPLTILIRHSLMQTGSSRTRGGSQSGDVSPRSDSSDVLASHQSFSLEMSKISIGGDFDDNISDAGSDTSRSATDKDGASAEESVKAVEVVETKAEPVVAEQVKKKPLTEAELDEIVTLEVCGIE